MDMDDVRYLLNLWKGMNKKRVIGVVVSVLATIFFISSEALQVSSFSMDPTFIKGDIVLVERISLYVYPPKRGSLIVYKDPRQKDEHIVIKRVVGLPNEQVEIKDDIVSVVNEEGVKTQFEKDSALGRRDNGPDWSIPLNRNDYLLLGDNRPGSKDGRTTGTIQENEMIGRAYFIVWPVSRIGFVK